MTKSHAKALVAALTLAIAVVRVNRPQAQIVAQLAFGLVFAACPAILITNEFPFSTMNPISPEPLQKALESLNR
jgi:hypothetical protein